MKKVLSVILSLSLAATQATSKCSALNVTDMLEHLPEETKVALTQYLSGKKNLTDMNLSLNISEYKALVSALKNSLGFGNSTYGRVVPVEDNSTSVATHESNETKTEVSETAEPTVTPQAEILSDEETAKDSTEDSREESQSDAVDIKTAAVAAVGIAEVGGFVGLVGKIKQLLGLQNDVTHRQEELKVNAEALNRRSEELDGRENGLTERENGLSDRESQLEVRENGLNDREAELETDARNLDGIKAELDARQVELDGRENELTQEADNLRRDKGWLEKGKATLDEREKINEQLGQEFESLKKELKKQDAALADEANDLDKRKEDLDAREADLGKKEAELEKQQEERDRMRQDAENNTDEKHDSDDDRKGWGVDAALALGSAFMSMPSNGGGKSSAHRNRSGLGGLALTAVGAGRALMHAIKALRSRGDSQDVEVASQLEQLIRQQDAVSGLRGTSSLSDSTGRAAVEEPVERQNQETQTTEPVQPADEANVSNELPPHVEPEAPTDEGQSADDAELVRFEEDENEPEKCHSTEEEAVLEDEMEEESAFSTDAASENQDETVTPEAQPGSDDVGNGDGDVEVPERDVLLAESTQEADFAIENEDENSPETATPTTTPRRVTLTPRSTPRYLTDSRVRTPGSAMSDGSTGDAEWNALQKQFSDDKRLNAEVDEEAGAALEATNPANVYARVFAEGNFGQLQNILGSLQDFRAFFEKNKTFSGVPVNNIERIRQALTEINNTSYDDVLEALENDDQRELLPRVLEVLDTELNAQPLDEVAKAITFDEEEESQNEDVELVDDSVGTPAQPQGGDGTNPPAVVVSEAPEVNGDLPETQAGNTTEATPAQLQGGNGEQPGATPAQQQGGNDAQKGNQVKQDSKVDLLEIETVPA